MDLCVRYFTLFIDFLGISFNFSLSKLIVLGSNKLPNGSGMQFEFTSSAESVLLSWVSSLSRIVLFITATFGAMCFRSSNFVYFYGISNRVNIAKGAQFIYIIWYNIWDKFVSLWPVKRYIHQRGCFNLFTWLIPRTIFICRGHFVQHGYMSHQIWNKIYKLWKCILFQKHIYNIGNWYTALVFVFLINWLFIPLCISG